jgi:hypothetical protein
MKSNTGNKARLAASCDNPRILRFDWLGEVAAALESSDTLLWAKPRMRLVARDLGQDGCASVRVG